MHNSLSILSEHENKKQILLAEVIGMIHNYGKLSKNFIINYSRENQIKKGDAITKNSAINYDLEHTANPTDIVTEGMKSENIIKTKFGRDLLQELANEGYWLEKEAQVINEFASQYSSTSQNLKTIKRLVGRICSEICTNSTFTSDEVNRVRDLLNSAFALAQLWQSSATKAFQQLDLINKDDEQYQFLINTYLEVNELKSSIAEIILFMWDRFHASRDDDRQQRDEVLKFWTGRNSIFSRYLITSHGCISGVEKSPRQNEYTSDEFISNQLDNHARVASAFGYEGVINSIDIDTIDNDRDSMFKKIIHYSQKIAQTKEVMSDFRQSIKDISEIMSSALGDTQRPINDVTLWDYSASIATLFKAAIAKAILEKRFIETGNLRWSLLSVRYNGLEYLSRAHHISDLLARKELVDNAIEEIKTVIEIDFPLGNEIYRDENGSVLVVPYLEDKNGQNLLSFTIENRQDFKSYLYSRFSRSGEHPLDGEILPAIKLSQGLPGNDLLLTQITDWNSPTLEADKESIAKWWESSERNGEICTVCGLRPIGHGAPDNHWDAHLKDNHAGKKEPTLKCEVCKAQSRNICWTCMERRGDRAKRWATSELSTTIWLNEIADINGRIAILVGRFDLDGWLDGTLIETLQKSASFARIRRCWNTTQKFWQDVKENTIPNVLKISANEFQKSHKRIIFSGEISDKSKLGKYHVYEIEIDRINFNFVWDVEKNYFISADNLYYIVKQMTNNQEIWGQSEEVYKFIKRKLRGKDIVIKERKGYGKIATEVCSINKIRVEQKEGAEYVPNIHLLSDPFNFLTFIPADRAFSIIEKIKVKYEDEIGKVRDRLPIKLGIVYTHRHTPLRAVIEAAQSMLKENTDDWKERGEFWETKSLEPENWDINTTTLNERIINFTNELKWRIKMKMGDNETPDYWYLHYLKNSPCDSTTFTEKKWIHAGKLKSREHGENNDEELIENGTKIHIHPSTFDFQFLDVAGRRFDICYDEKGRRKGLPRRPYYLEEIESIQNVWEKISDKEKGLTNTQIHALVEEIEKRREIWDGEYPVTDDTFKQFVKDALGEAFGKIWKNVSNQNLLEKAAISGMLTDVVELYMKIMKQDSLKKNNTEETDEHK